MSVDVGNKSSILASSNSAKSNASNIGTSLFHSLRSFHSIQRMICPLLALLSPMMRVVMMILLLNLRIHYQREISLNMLRQQRRPHRCRQRHLLFLQRKQQCHLILLQRERIHLQREITVAIMSGLGIRIIVWSVWIWIYNYMPLHTGVIISLQWPRSCLRIVSVWITSNNVAVWMMRAVWHWTLCT